MENVYQAPESDITTHDNDATQPVKLFNAKGRMGRVRYVAYTVGLTLLIYMAFLLVALVAGASVGAAGGGEGLTSVLGGAGIILFAAFYIFILAITIWATIQRCHDFNVSGWLTLLLIIPFAVFVFWFVPGTKGENKYGLKPEPNKAIHWIGATVAPILMVVGILAAIAIPAYQDYVERAKSAQTQSYDG
ncbi:MAG: DUF805 domain-containing protein [Gammaproteobacteria bacterium]|nr:DUF805 domain-containing protein [Gammaproteobacteria bacterium]